jgi:hypothetical protein
MCLGWNFDNAQDLVRVLIRSSLPSLSMDFLYLPPPHPNIYPIPRADCEKLSDEIPSGRLAEVLH